jgi:hypothetical protein
VSPGIVVVTKETLEVLMKVKLPYTKDSFDVDTQNRFLLAVSKSVQTPFENLYIKSVVEKTSSRRMSRKLLEVSVEVEFAIRVQDAAAQAAMIANDGLTERKLNSELAKQVFPASADFSRRQCLLCLLQTALRGRAAMIYARVCTAPVSPSNRG